MTTTKKTPEDQKSQHSTSHMTPSFKDAKRTWPRFLKTLKSEAKAVIADYDAAIAKSSVRASLKYGAKSNAKRVLAYVFAKLVLLSCKSDRDEVVDRYLKEMALAPDSGAPFHAVVGKTLQLDRTSGRRVRSEQILALRFLISQGIGPKGVDSFPGSIRSWSRAWGALSDTAQKSTKAATSAVRSKETVNLAARFGHGRKPVVIGNSNRSNTTVRSLFPPFKLPAKPS